MSRNLGSGISAAALAAGQEAVGQGVLPGLRASQLGDSASADSIARLNREAHTIQDPATIKLLNKAIIAVQRGEYVLAEKTALKALKKNERAGPAWHVLAVAREKTGDFASSMHCYEAALKLLPDESAVAGDLGRLAFRMEMPEIAAKLFMHCLNANPTSLEATNNLACALRDLNQESAAIDILKPAIQANPTQPVLWNTLGTVMCSLGEGRTAVTFFDEALRLAPHFGKGLHNRAFALLDLGDVKGALADCDAGIEMADSAEDLAAMRFARSTILLALGRVAEGWEAYGARLSTELAGVPNYQFPVKAWKKGDDLAGKRLLVVAEQGLGDEVMFANTLPDVAEALGPDGALSILVERRLVPLFERSYPEANVAVHRTVSYQGHIYRDAPFIEDWSGIDCWAPMGSLLETLRPSVEAFPKRERFLTPDPERVAHWKKVLEDAPPGPKVGLLWKSLKLNAERARLFSPFELWEPVLKTPGVSFINLQYGDCDEEIAYAREQLGVEIWTPPGIDLKQDLDDVAALSCALDLVIGFSNATINLAGACGAPIWMLTGAASWTRLGSDHSPWYPQCRCFIAPDYDDWRPIMADVAGALADFAK
ncbi:flagellar protein FlbA [Caulobacter endophyticus]|uniref:flagellar protein FlbA n=1 Tax=Caulobacter endophyticus TaxID=2172652 RepID=UPI00240F4DB8|nr:flagellar protein FlbA [Caulobacter endophyticus]MDG2527447.1 flagellar protein FlbA [Caulobacter endophyticus]